MCGNRAALLLVVSSLVLASCSDRVCDPCRETPRDLTAAERQVVQSYNAFGLKVFRQVVSSDGADNVFISPASISMALGMTLNGAEGATEEAMKSTLEVTGLTMEEINASCRGLIDLLTGLDPEVQLGVGNSIWYRSGEVLREAFLSDCRTYFDAEVSALDFSDPDAADVINAWVDSLTRGRIKEIVAKPIDPAFVMFLVNAIYFKGTWTYQFDPELTRDGQFTGPDGSARPCRMMEQPEPGEHGEYMYYADDAVQAIDLPYADGWFSMTILLPREGARIDDFIAGLTTEAWDGWLAGIAEHDGTIAMPRFKLEYSRRLDAALADLGMGVAFTPAADFSGMREGGGLWIGEVKHKTFIEVNEQGTEAAAVTSVGMVDSVPETFEMRVDRPFVFAIRERHSGTILFIGKIGDPGPGQ